MCLLPQDERHLSRALDLARDAAAFASPNPTVGCVLTCGNEVLGEGAHYYDDRDHAEIVALKQAVANGQSTQGATAYVTLEPCSHQGRTGPCDDALIAAGVSRCVVATVDPNPQVRNQGIAKLRAAGVEVLLADPASTITRQARRLNDAFAFSIQHHRPFVTLKTALSIDGKLAPPTSQRTATAPHWLTGEAARSDVQHLRHNSDAILTGIGTILADNPSLTDRTNLPSRRPLLRIVLDTHLQTPLDSELTGGLNDLLIITAPSAPQDRIIALRQRGAEVLVLPSKLENSKRYIQQKLSPSRIDLPALLAELHTRNIRSLLVEAGSTLNGSLLNSHLVDQAVLYYAETELGPDAIPFACDYPSPYVLQSQLTQVDRRSFRHGQGEDIRISGYLHDPWANIDNPKP